MKHAKAAPLLALVLALGLSGCSSDSDNATLTIDNQSSVMLTEINLAPIDSPVFGPNLLDGDVLLPGEVITVVDIPCDFFDVRVVDEFGTNCILPSVDLCFSDALWVIDDFELAACDEFFFTPAPAD
jgi:hypothetical protein